jgi:lipid-binding SYLF domain-containing protein
MKHHYNPKKEILMRIMIRLSVVALMVTLFTATYLIQPAMAVDTSKLDRAAANVLKKLCAKSYAARELSKVAKGILVFPRITKVGFLVGGQYGEGVMLQNGKPTGYFNTVAASYGFQAGAQEFGYAMFFMDNASLEYLNKSEGWEIGVGPSIVIVDEGIAKTITSSTTQEGIYAFIFNQKGLMAGMGLQGSKISRINP